MTIAVHLRRFAAGRIGGQENLVRHLLAALTERPLTADQELVVLGSPSEAESLQAMAAGARVVLIEQDADESAVHRILERNAVELLVGPLMQLEPTVPSMPAVVFIPDLQHEFLPEHFTRAELNRRHREYRPAALHARRVVTFSEHAKNSLIERYGVDENRIRIIPHGADEEFRPEADPAAGEALERFDLPRDFAYYPANFWPHKNHPRLFEALRKLEAGGRTLDLVLTGSADSGRGEAETAAARADYRGARFLGRLPRAEVAELMRRARVLVFPSLYEGFGIPIIEAFACGTPVVASNAASCPEVAGGAAVLVDPNDSNELAAAIERAAWDEETRSELRRRGLARARDFSWPRSRAEMRKALLEATASPPVAGSAAGGEDWLGLGRYTPQWASTLASGAPGAGALIGGRGPRGCALPASVLHRHPDAVSFSNALVRANALEEVGARTSWPTDAGEGYELWLRLADRYPLVAAGGDLRDAPSSPLQLTAQQCARAIAALERLGVRPPYEWRRRQARAILGPGWPRFIVQLVALWIGLRDSPGQRRAYFAEWRRASGLPS